MNNRYIKSYGSLSLNKPTKKKRNFLFFSIFKKKDNRIIAREPSRVININNARGHSQYKYQKKQVSRNWKKIIIYSLLFILLATWLILMLYLPYFRIKDIEFQGLKIIEINEISEYVNDEFLKGIIIPRNNFFLLRSKKIERNLLQKYGVDEIKVTKIFPQKLLIEIKEKISTIIYYNGSNYYLLDKNGEIIKKITLQNDIKEEILEEEDIQATTTPSNELTISSTTELFNTSTDIMPGSISTSSLSNSMSVATINTPEWRKLAKDYEDIPIFWDKNNLSEYSEKEFILRNEIIEFIIEWDKILKEEGIGDARYFETENLASGLALSLDKPWKIYIQPNNSLENQIANLKIILSSRNTNPSEYIDLRFNERVFWK